MQLSLDKLPINAFDFALVVVVVVGLITGRKNGMSGEMINLFKWLAVVFCSAELYEPVGNFFVQTSSLFSPLSAYLIAYLAVGLVIFALFAGLKALIGGKLLGSDIFGQSEYYLGMGSGLVRTTCILLVVLALLNARAYSSREVKEMENFQNDVYGSNYFPTLHSVQATVFDTSLAGPWIRQNLSFLLIKPTAPQNKQFKQQEAYIP